MSKSPLVSILIPCYNHEKFLDDCLQGVYEQTYNTIELLICDDCSPDNSYKKICEYKEYLERRFERVVIIQNETNQGVTKNINRMLKMANGVYIKVIASDDVLVPEAIESYVEYAQAHAEAGIFISNGARIAESEHYPDYARKSLIYVENPEFECKDLLEKTFVRNDIFAPGAFIRKVIFETYGFYDEEVAIEDLEFWLRILKEQKEQFRYIDQVLVLYRINGNSMTSMSGNIRMEQRRMRFHKAEIAILKKYYDCVDTQLAANTILLRYITEKGIAIDHKLNGLEEYVNQEIREFNDWQHVSFRIKRYYVYRTLKLWLKKRYFKLKEK